MTHVNPAADNPRTPARPSLSAQLGRLLSERYVRLLAICLACGVVVAVMTGPAGTNEAPTSGFSGALGFPRVLWFLAFGAVLFGVIAAWDALGTEITALAKDIVAWAFRVTEQRRARLAVYAAIAAFGFIWLSWSWDDTWKCGVCIELGFAFAAMDLAVLLYESRSFRVARLAVYWLCALYGVLVVDEQRVLEIPEQDRGRATRPPLGPHPPGGSL